MISRLSDFRRDVLYVYVGTEQVIINYLVDQAEKRATTSRKKADQVK